MTTDYTEIGTIDPGTAILLLGSGFSLESTNIRGENPPNGARLRSHFASVLGLPVAENYTLQVLTDEFSDDSPEKLYSELYTIFRIHDFSANQKNILSSRWHRIYTTNYDDTVEICQLKSGLNPQSFDSSDQIPNKLPSNSIIHLHGSIRSITPDNLTRSLVLGERSYVQQYVDKSPWYNQFQADIRFSSGLFIVGYSMADYHISALLLENPDIARKTWFIQGATADPMFERRTRTYGRTLFIGLEKFASAIKNLPRPDPLTDVSKLKNFRELNPHRDKKAIKAPTANEIFDLLVFGTFNYSRCVATFPEQTYVVSRQQQVNDLLSEIQKNRSIVVDGRLGNGKTIFLHLAFLALAEQGYSCFLFKDAKGDIDAEIRLIQSLPKAAIFFEHYAISQDKLKALDKKLPNAKFIVEIRSSIFDVRFHEISQSVPKPFARISVNRLSKSDIEAFKELCSKAGIASDALSKGVASKEIRDVLLELFESPNIREKIDSVIRPVFQRESRRKILLLAALFGESHISIDPSFIRTVTGVDPYKEFHPVKEAADEIFKMGPDEFVIRSSIFADYAVRTFLEPLEIIDCIVDASIAAAVRKHDRVYRVLMSNLMQYSNLRSLLQKHLNPAAAVIDVYERLRYDTRINDEPLFWLQYAIAMSEIENLAAAEEFIDTAYSRARERDGFQTYQIDTQAFRILLLVETQAPRGTSVDRFSDIIEKLELLNSMLLEESHRAYALKVLEGVYVFVERRREDLTLHEKTVLTYWLATLGETLSQLSPDFRARYGSDSTQKVIASAKQLLVS